MSIQSEIMKKQRTHSRLGVYAVAVENGAILLTEKGKGGCYEGLFDLPGGGVEFGESAEMTLRREVLEEVGMVFEKMIWFDNLSVVFDVPAEKLKCPGVVVQKDVEEDIITFHQLGQIYRIEGLTKVAAPQDASSWIEIETLSLDQLTPFAKEVVSRLQTKSKIEV